METIEGLLNRLPSEKRTDIIKKLGYTMRLNELKCFEVGGNVPWEIHRKHTIELEREIEKDLIAIQYYKYYEEQAANNNPLVAPSFVATATVALGTDSARSAVADAYEREEEEKILCTALANCNIPGCASCDRERDIEDAVAPCADIFTETTAIAKARTFIVPKRQVGWVDGFSPRQQQLMTGCTEARFCNVPGCKKCERDVDSDSLND